MVIPATIPPMMPCQDGDYILQYQYLLEWCTLRLPQFPYYRLNTPTSQIDDIHHEIMDTEKTWKPYKYVHGMMEPVSTEQNQEKMGQDWNEEFMLYISLPSLVESELATVNYEYRLDEIYTQNGDRFWYASHLFEVVNNIDTAMWGADGVSPMWYEYKCVSVRPAAHKQAGTGYDFNPSGE